MITDTEESKMVGCKLAGVPTYVVFGITSREKRMWRII